MTIRKELEDHINDAYENKHQNPFVMNVHFRYKGEDILSHKCTEYLSISDFDRSLKGEKHCGSSLIIDNSFNFYSFVQTKPMFKNYIYTSSYYVKFQMSSKINIGHKLAGLVEMPVHMYDPGDYGHEYDNRYYSLDEILILLRNKQKFGYDMERHYYDLKAFVEIFNKNKPIKLIEK